MDISETISKYFKLSVIALAIYFVLAYVILALSHISFPFALEWIEGSMLDHVRRVLSGKQLYAPPSVEFVPAIYPPFFF